MAFYDLGDSQFLVFLNNFISVANTNKTTLGMTAMDITNLTTLKAAYQTALDAKAAAAEAAKSATQAKVEAKAEALGKVRFWANQFYANPSVTPSLRLLLGLPAHDTTPSPAPVFTPNQVSASGYSNGTNVIKWKPNGNTYGVTYTIEYSRNNGVTWQAAGTSTARQFRHTGQPAQPTLYRVKATRRTITSAPSDPVALYFTSGPEVPLQIAA